VLSEGVTAEETSILEQNVQSGTATRSAINCPTAAKTGTTSELVDAWLDGYTPKYSTVVWMGYPNRRVSMTDVHGEPQQGGYLPAEIWHAYMSAVTEGKPCVPFPVAKESVSYVPFYGKFATTGFASQGREESELNASAKHHSKSQSHQHHESAPESTPKPTEAGGAHPQAESHESPELSGGATKPPPPAPASPSPGAGTTIRPSGGAAPG